MFKRLLLALIFAAVPAFAQYYPVSGTATLGGTQALTSGLKSSNYLQGVVPSATITVYLTGTTNLATIYSNATGTPLSNPFTANTAFSTNPGGFIFYSASGQGVDVVASGGIAPNTYLLPVTLITSAVPSNGQFCAITGCTMTGPLYVPDINGVINAQLSCANADNSTALQAAYNAAFVLATPPGTNGAKGTVQITPDSTGCMDFTFLHTVDAFGVPTQCIGPPRVAANIFATTPSITTVTLDFTGLASGIYVQDMGYMTGCNVVGPYQLGQNATLQAPLTGITVNTATNTATATVGTNSFIIGGPLHLFGGSGKDYMTHVESLPTGQVTFQVGSGFSETTAVAYYYPNVCYSKSNPLVITTATGSSGANSITVAAPIGIKAGHGVVGLNIQPYTVVANTYVPGSTTVPLSLPTTGALSTTPVRFAFGWEPQNIQFYNNNAQGCFVSLDASASYYSDDYGNIGGVNFFSSTGLGILALGNGEPLQQTPSVNKNVARLTMSGDTEVEGPLGLWCGPKQTNARDSEENGCGANVFGGVGMEDQGAATLADSPTVGGVIVNGYGNTTNSNYIGSYNTLFLSKSLGSVTGVSGVTFSNSGTIFLSNFNGCTGSTATVTLSGGAFGSAVVTSAGICPTAPTTATCANGTGTCAGSPVTITVATTTVPYSGLLGPYNDCAADGPNTLIGNRTGSPGACINPLDNAFGNVQGFQGTSTMQGTNIQGSLNFNGLGPQVPNSVTIFGPSGGPAHSFGLVGIDTAGNQTPTPTQFMCGDGSLVAPGGSCPSGTGPLEGLTGVSAVTTGSGNGTIFLSNFNNCGGCAATATVTLSSGNWASAVITNSGASSTTGFTAAPGTATCTNGSTATCGSGSVTVTASIGLNHTTNYWELGVPRVDGIQKWHVLIDNTTGSGNLVNIQNQDPYVPSLSSSTTNLNITDTATYGAWIPPSSAAGDQTGGSNDTNPNAVHNFANVNIGGKFNCFGPGCLGQETPVASLPSYSTTITALSPAAYFRLGESSGPTLADTSGNSPANNATVHGSAMTYGLPGLINEDRNTAIQPNSDGTSYATVATSGTMPSADTISVVLLFQRTSTQGVYQHLGSQKTAGLDIFFNPNNQLVFGTCCGATPNAMIASQNPITDTNSHMVGFTKAGASINIYVDGRPLFAPTVNYTLAPADGTFYLFNNVNHNAGFPGVVDEYAIFGTQLTAANILAIYQEMQTQKNGGNAYAIDGNPGTCPVAVGASFTASVSGTTMTVTGSPTGTLAVGQNVIVGSAPYPTITALGTGTGGAGTYTLSANLGTVTSQSMTSGSGTAVIYTGGQWNSPSCASGMTTGQVGIAGSATTITSSKALAGSGAGITTGPTTSTTTDCAQFTGSAGQIADSGSPCGGNISGMTATQVAIAGSASTITGSKALAGSGAAITTGPSSSTNVDCVQFTGTAGQIADAGQPCATAAAQTFWAGPWKNGGTGVTFSQSSADTISMWGFALPSPVTFSNIYLQVSTTDASDAVYGAAIIKDDGTAVCHTTSGVQLGSNGSATAFPCSEGTVTNLAPGTYRILTTSHSLTGKFGSPGQTQLVTAYSANVTGCTAASGVFNFSSPCSVSAPAVTNSGASVYPPSFMLH